MKTHAMKFFFLTSIISLLFVACQSNQSSNSTIQEQPVKNPHSDRTITVEKKHVDVQPAKDGITIAELFAHKSSYAGKTVRVKGQVTKFNAAIMKMNWVHLQDGTEFSGKYDLTVTTNLEVAVGEIVTLEGVVALDKDFGYGYAYEVLLENATFVKE